jgi:transposase
VLKKSRWYLLKRPGNLTDAQRIKLRDVLHYNLASVRAYLLKEGFQSVWDYDSPRWAGKFLDQSCRQVMRSRIEPMKKFARTIRTHRQLLLNYFRARKQFSSGVIEGLNNKAKVTMRKAYGFRTFRITNRALSCARQTTRTRTRPQFLLTNLRIQSFQKSHTLFDYYL